jgi:hypothetical protein
LKKGIFLILTALLLVAGAESGFATVFGIRYSNSPEPVWKGLSISTRGGVINFENKGRFGLYAGQQSGSGIFLVGADYNRFKFTLGDSLIYSRRLTVDIGYRYRLIPADKAKAMNFSPFVAAHIFKSYAKVSADSAFLSPTDAKYLQDISNDEGGWISVGAEYSFAPAFSLGAEGGLRYTRANSGAYGYDIKLREYDTFVALLLSFYLL